MLTSVQNNKIKEIIKLRKTSKRKKSGLIVVEGKQEIGLALESGLKIEQLFYAPELSRQNVFVEQKSSMVEVSRSVFQHISVRENPDGFLATFVPVELTLAQTKLSKLPFVVVLEGLEKPGNLGAIMRTCDAVGVDVVILSDAKVDVYNPNVIRASLGTVFTNQIVIEKQENIEKWLRLNKIKTYAATPSANCKFTDKEYKAPTAILIGTEHDGLSEKWLNSADEKIKIPMLGRIDSLNASVSAGIIIYEVLRQRSSLATAPFSHIEKYCSIIVNML